MEYIPIRQQPNTPLLERHPVSVTVWDPIPRGLTVSDTCHHIWRANERPPGGRWAWGNGVQYRMVGAWSVLFEFNDATFGVVQRQHLGPALAALDHESLQAPVRATPPQSTFSFSNTSSGTSTQWATIAEEETHNCTWCEEEHDPHCDDCECVVCLPD